MGRLSCLGNACSCDLKNLPWYRLMLQVGLILMLQLDFRVVLQHHVVFAVVMLQASF